MITKGISARGLNAKRRYAAVAMLADALAACHKERVTPDELGAILADAYKDSSSLERLSNVVGRHAHQLARNG